MNIFKYKCKILESKFSTHPKRERKRAELNRTVVMAINLFQPKIEVLNICLICFVGASVRWCDEVSVRIMSLAIVISKLY